MIEPLTNTLAAIGIMTVTKHTFGLVADYVTGSKAEKRNENASMNVHSPEKPPKDKDFDKWHLPKRQINDRNAELFEGLDYPEPHCNMQFMMHDMMIAAGAPEPLKDLSEMWP